MKYYIIAGERSGDLHASNLIKAIKKEDSTAEFRGIGGDYIHQAGAELLFHYKEISFMGFLEVFSNLSVIRKALQACKADITKYKPDVLILVDFAGFNLRVAKFAKEINLKVFYYISPKIWAWNQK
jgi:lipid-A-disaccharide synthase